MEYRVRRRTYPSRRRRAGRFRGWNPAGFAAFALFALVVYLLGASKLGDYLANDLIAPAILHLSEPADTPVPVTTATPAPERAERQVVLESYDCHTLQMGVYTSEENANAQSDSLRALGGAGYIVEDGDRYRVLAAGYPDGESAAVVRGTLLESGIDARIHVISGGKRTLTIIGEKERAEAVAAAAAYPAELLQELFQASMTFDEEKQTLEQGKAALRPLRTQAENRAKDLLQLENQETAAMAAVYETLIAAMKNGEAVGERTGFASALKALYLQGAIAYCAYLSGT